MKKLRKDAMNIVGAGAMFGVGSNVLGSAGINSVHGQTAVGNLSGALPMLGTLSAAGMTLRQLKKMKK